MTARIAIVQAAPVTGDLDACLAALERHVRQAARAGAALVVAGETWLGGYPAWIDHCAGVGLWNSEPVKRAYAIHRAGAARIPGPATEALGALARELGVCLVVGANERVDAGPGSGTLYNALLVFTADGALAVHHRKLVPTYTERLIWGPGDGAGLRAVEIDFGNGLGNRLGRGDELGGGPGGGSARVRVGGLICWEHWMPLARQAMHEQGERVHVAVWPAVGDIHQLASRHYAIEGRCFVIAAGLIMRASDVPAPLQGDLPAELAPRAPGDRDPLRPHGDGDDGGDGDGSRDPMLLAGGSCVFGPDGACVLEPAWGREDVLVADLDLGAIDREVMTLDVTGHYARPDVLSLSVSRTRPGAPPDPPDAPPAPRGGRE